MTLYNLYIYDQQGLCLHYGEWYRKKQSGMSQDEESKLMYGMIYSLKSFVSKISPLCGTNSFISYKTTKYKLNMYETPSGLKFIANTDVNAANVREFLHELYKEVYVEYVVKNPECQLGEAIGSTLFRNRLDTFVRSSSLFSAVKSN